MTHNATQRLHLVDAHSANTLPVDDSIGLHGRKIAGFKGIRQYRNPYWSAKLAAQLAIALLQLGMLELVLVCNKNIEKSKMQKTGLRSPTSSPPTPVNRDREVKSFLPGTCHHKKLLLKPLCVCVCVSVCQPQII